MFLNQILYMCCAQYYSVRSADNGLLCNCVSPSLLGSSTPYWGRINSEKTWPTNGVLKFISLSPQWGRKLNCSKRLLGEKISVGAFSGLLAWRVLYWQIIETALGRHSPSWSWWVLWTMVWLLCQLRPISSEKSPRNAIWEPPNYEI
jgi:hypothetical protein